LLPYIYWA